MTFGAPDSAVSNSMRIPSIVILGADALLAASPATPIQLAHACALVGYQHVVPASWGDELIAAASLRALRDHARTPAIQCSCPYVAHRLLAVGTDLRPFLVSLVAPPVVLARYLRSVDGPRKLRITYVGRCPGAADEAIDARLTPEELLAIFTDHQIAIADQPQVFDSVIPPDRRRFRSQPGGLPSADMLWSTDTNGGVARSLVELYGDELPVELAQHLLAGKPVLIDVAPKLGCVCSGASADSDPTQARARVTALEPPRASSAVVDESFKIDATLALPASPRSAIDLVSPPTAYPATHGGGGSLPNDATRDDETDPLLTSRAGKPETATPTPPHVPVVGRRHSPVRGLARPVNSNLPTARDADGRQLPRTYVARRRPPARIVRNASADIEAPIPATNDTAPQGQTTPPTAPDDLKGAATSTLAAPYGSGVEQVVTPSLSPLPAGSLVSPLPDSEPVDRSPSPTRTPASRTPDSAPDTMPRYSERAVALPVTPRSDGRPRDGTSPPNLGGDRPVMQLLTLGLLISMIVLVSAAVGVLVGRWMSQH